MLHVAVEYMLSLGSLPEVTEETSELGKISGLTGITQEESSSDPKASYLSINLGLSFPIGGN
jgi:hypothetical protein